MIFTHKKTKNIYCPKDNVIVAKSINELKVLKNLIQEDKNLNEESLNFNTIELNKVGALLYYLLYIINN